MATITIRKPTDLACANDRSKNNRRKAKIAKRQAIQDRRIKALG